MTDDRPIDLPSDCESVIRGLWDYLDAELDEESIAEIREHLDACNPCNGHADFERRLLEELAKLRRQPSDPEALRSRVEAALESLRTEP